ncbi:choice-of-anchor U domain-containing protein [Chloroflexota bacterium]
MIKKVIRVVGLLTLTLCLAAGGLWIQPSNSVKADTGWLTQVADSTTEPAFTSIALDSSNNPHIAYTSGGTHQLWYTRWNGTSWDTPTVVDNTSGDLGWFTSIAVDGSDHPHISYYDHTNTSLKYARYDGATWNKETVDNTGEVGLYGTSLVLDASGNPHISYMTRGTLVDLKYARYDGMVWNIETVDSGDDRVGFYSSLALENSFSPHISYIDETNNKLKYARWTGSVWDIQTLCDIDATSIEGMPYNKHTSISLDGSGYAHISYWKPSGLWYTRYNGTTWAAEEKVSGSGKYNRLALDSLSLPHISYQSGDELSLKYARFNGTSWTTETVDSSEDPLRWGGRFAAITIDNNDWPHISYYCWQGDWATGMAALKYAAVAYVHPSPVELWKYDLIDDVTDLAVGKLNEDDNEDVVTIDAPPPPNLHVLYGQDGGDYWGKDFDGLSVAVGDIDGDSLNEVVAARVDGGDVNNNGLYAYEHDGTEKWDSHYFVADWITDIEIGDIDGDGTDDVVACDSVSAGAVYVVDGITGLDLDVDINPSTDEWPVSIELENFLDIAVGHLDDTYGLDIAAISEGSPATLYVFSSMGEVLDTVDISGRSVEIGDVDGDESNEIVAGTSNGWVRAYSYDGEVLVEEYAYCVGSPVTDVELGDLDGDVENGVEVACITSTIETLYALDIDEEQVMWEYPMSWSTDYFGESIAIGDIDRDYKNEVIACSSETTHYVYAFDGVDNNGDGEGDLVFAPYEFFTSGGERRITDLEIGDLDGDGDQDIVFGTTENGESRPGQVIALACFERTDMTATGSGTVYFDADPSTLENLTPIDESSLPVEGKPDYDYPHGFFNFEIAGLDPGQTALVTVTLPQVAPIGTKWVKYHDGVYYVLPIGDDDGDNVITIELTNGATGEDDDEDPNNSTLIDDGGPGYPLLVGGEVLPIDKVTVLAPWIALTMVITAGGLYMVRRRVHN